MSLQDTPRGERLHIALLGRRNSGKSSLINALSNQEAAIVSPQAGTTTDPVYRPMEILPLGPVVLIDTPGYDDEGELGALRVKKTREVFAKTDVALLVLEATTGWTEEDRQWLQILQSSALPVLIVWNKIDLLSTEEQKLCCQDSNDLKNIEVPSVFVSARTGQGLTSLLDELIKVAQEREEAPPIIADLINPGDVVILVVPIDDSAPKGRIILPQVQTLRELLDHQAITIVVQPENLTESISKMASPPTLVVTDSQAFHQVKELLPPQMALTSFSILMARYKGDIKELNEGLQKIEKLEPGQSVLIVEACTHRRQHQDIGTVQIPKLLEKKASGKLNFQFASGQTMPEDLSSYNLIVHCGACMINRKQMLSRITRAKVAGVPIVNYGILLAHFAGIHARAIEPLRKISFQ
ncbi:[FeFe] hydrogenase H-cluster maturation GTPase HydF [Heliorestis acidaminivorans]|uniref:[FeFe] hydrogenase H-cluster maturation GTPase HydF n=1 Tax=Heliorestis acidaminivorans TaxID=553427 RepID=A0A6I0EY54_9FIRM|nr:[FeFe] hydrogenase H-cluster maturation GTPase HydF [Heliorestis acidaminivorans]KAB2953341.1 [FeFe] hydrogenase H-cluster maturation GTPase HydF [Heliorestis acidaminivorans]